MNTVKNNSVMNIQSGVRYLSTVILVAAMSLMWSCKSDNNQQQKVVDQAAVTAVATADKDSLQSEVNAAHMHVDDLMTTNHQLNAELEAKNKEIAMLKKKLKNEQKDDKKYAAEIKNAKKMISDLTNDAKELAGRIGLLQGDNKQLASERDSLMGQYIALKKLGSVLHASNIRLTAIHLKHSGRKEKHTAKARKTNLLRIDFDIDENRIAEDGTKDLYMVIKDPSGKLLVQNAAVPDMMQTYDGNALAYTLQKRIALKQNQPVKDIVINWKQEDEYSKGTYEVNIYNGGYVIGEGKVALR